MPDSHPVIFIIRNILNYSVFQHISPARIGLQRQKTISSFFSIVSDDLEHSLFQLLALQLRPARLFHLYFTQSALGVLLKKWRHD